MINRAAVIGVAALCITGCRPSPAPKVDPSVPGGEQSAGLETVTIYVAGMNQKLQIL